MSEIKLSRTQEELEAVKDEGTNSKKVLNFLFTLTNYISAAEISSSVGMDVKTVQAAISYSKLHDQAEIDRVQNGRVASYLLVKINPDNIGSTTKYEYTSESGITFQGIPHIARHLKVSKESIIYQVKTTGKSLDEAILYLRTIGTIGRKEENGLVFVKKAMHCPRPPLWSGSLTPQARV
ncbi:hypothetical protein NVP1232O_61 [Vibrio phage 1.232.O._10N.261.51.E11]|nr:hypothetical protein NVP1232O_61 [Vibrio phage 1.232.O._10N.261.51.E11]